MNKKTELEVLFPGQEVVIKIGDKEVPVMVTPLSLEDLPKVAKSFGSLMKLAESGQFLPSEIAAKGLEELLLLIPYCIDLSPKSVPATQVPDLLEVVIEQNITEEVVGKWMSLVQKLIKSTGQDVESLTETLKNQQKK